MSLRLRECQCPSRESRGRRGWQEPPTRLSLARAKAVSPKSCGPWRAGKAFSWPILITKGGRDRRGIRTFTGQAWASSRSRTRQPGGRGRIYTPAQSPMRAEQRLAMTVGRTSTSDMSAHPGHTSPTSPSTDDGPRHPGCPAQPSGTRRDVRNTLAERREASALGAGGGGGTVRLGPGTAAYRHGPARPTVKPDSQASARAGAGPRTSTSRGGGAPGADHYCDPLHPPTNGCRATA